MIDLRYPTNKRMSACQLLDLWSLAIVQAVRKLENPELFFAPQILLTM